MTRALELAEHYSSDFGWRVIPLRAFDKRPAISDWLELATRDPERLRGWLADARAAGVGIICDGLVVLDVDVRDGKPGRESLARLVADFGEHGIGYVPSQYTRSELYEMAEPLINAGLVELLDHDRMREQFLGLVQRGARIDHVPGEHDDYANSAAGAVVLAARSKAQSIGVVAIYSEQQLQIQSDLGWFRREPFF